MNLRRYLGFWVVCLFLFSACRLEAPFHFGQTRTPPEPTPITSYPGLSSEALTTLQSLEQVHGYPLYRMVYYGDFPPMSQAQSLSQATWAATSQPWSCSLFAALGDPDSPVYGRNFDWEFSPALVLFSQPQGRYASVSMVDIAYLGFDGENAQNLTEMPLEALKPLLYAPWLPFDGMNEMGLVVGMAAVPPGEMAPDPNLATIGSLAVMREILDRAADVGQAVDILASYNLDFEGGPPLHYLFADRHGQAALIEFYQGDMWVIPNQEPWHLATNFLVSAVDSPEGVCERYDVIQRHLEEMNGSFDLAGALGTLQQVSQENTQWSIAYNLVRGTIFVAMGRDFHYNHVYRDWMGVDPDGTLAPLNSTVPYKP